MRDSNPYIALYSYAFLIIGSFFAINLFIGVVIDKFSRMKEEFEGSAFQTKVRAVPVTISSQAQLPSSRGPWAS